MKRFTLLILLSLLIKLTFATDITINYTVTREASPSALPASGATVTIFHSTYCNPAQTSATDANGKVSFTLTGLPATFDIRLDETITLSGYNTITRTGAALNSTRVRDYYSFPWDVTYFLFLPTTTLNVLVAKDVATTGTPIAGASVTFTCANPVINTTVVTGADGIASLPGLTRPTGSAGNYTITIAIASITGYSAFTNTSQAVNYNATSALARKDVALMWLYTLNFAITDFTSSPIAGASMTCTGTPSSTAKTTDAGGLVSFTKQRGSITYVTTATGYADSTASLTTAAFTVDPINIATIKLKSAYNINFTITDEAAVPVSGASIVLTKGTTTLPTLTTSASGQASSLKRINGIYSYLITKTGYADKIGTLTVSGADNNQALTLVTGADFTFTVKNGSNNIKNDTITINGITKVTPTNGQVKFGLPGGNLNFTNKNYFFVKNDGNIFVDLVTPANNVSTINLTPIYSLKVQTKNENSTIVPNSTVIFNGKTYKTDATGTVYIYGIAPKAANENQYYTVRVIKDGYGEFTDSIKCGLTSTKTSVNPPNRWTLDGNYFVFSKPRIDFNYNPSMNFVKLLVNGVDQSGIFTFQGGGTMYNVTPGIYSWYMTYNTAGFAPARGKVEVKSNQNGLVNVNFAAGYNIEVYTLDGQSNTIENTLVTLDDTTIHTDASGLALFKTRVAGTYPFTAYQKDGSNNIIAKAKGQINLGTATETKVVTLLPIADSIIVTVYDNAWENLVGANVTCENALYTTNAQGKAFIPVSEDGTYTYSITASGFFSATKTVTVAGSNIEDYTSLKKQYSATFTINDGINPIEGAIIKVDGHEAITGTTGIITLDKVFKSNWEAYTYSVSVVGYPDYIGTFYVGNSDVIVDPISFTTKAYDANLTINYSNGYPASNAIISINNAVLSANTLGRILVQKLVNGTYDYVISSSGNVDYVGTITVADANLNQTITLTSGYDLTVQVVNGPSGTVGLANTPVTINSVTKNTDANGNVTFGVPNNSAIHTTVTKTGFVDATLDIADVNTNMSVSVYLTPAYSIKVNVVDDYSYNPIEGATIVLNSITKLTDINGNAQFDNVAPSATAYDYTVTGPGNYSSTNGTIDLPFTSPPDYLATDNIITVNQALSSPGVYFALAESEFQQYKKNTIINFDGVNYQFDNEFAGGMIDCSIGTHTYVVTPEDVTKAIVRGTVTVSGNTKEFVVVYVQDGRKVEIYTIDKNSNPIEGAEVTFNNLIVSTDATGDAVFERTQMGEYTYSVSKTGYIGVTDKPLSVNTADVLEIATLLLPGYNATFTITDGTSPIQGATVTIDGIDVISDADGKAIFTDVSNGTYSYSVSKSGYETKMGNVTVEDGDIFENVALELLTYTLTFNVSNGTSAIDGASVTINTTTVTTDASGHAVFTNMVPNTFSYSVSATGYNNASGSVTVTNADVTKDVTMSLTAYSITFTVNNGTGAIAGASITINTTTVTTDASGHAVFTNILPNTYSYSVTANSYNNASGTVSVTNADATKTVTMISTGIGNNEISSIRVYPNPTSGNINLTIPLEVEKDVTVRVVNLIGTVMNEVRVCNTDKVALDLSSYSNGIYFIQINGLGNVQTIRVVKN